MLFQSIVRMWCRTYKPMLDSATNGNRRFYLTDSTAGVVEMAKGIMPKMSPCVVMEAALSGNGPIERPSFSYPIYFFVRARDMKDGDAAAEAITEAWYHAQQFLTWLRTRRQRELEQNIDGDFARIDLSGFMNIDTVGPLEDGWYAILVQLEREEPLDLCEDESLYIETE